MDFWLETKTIIKLVLMNHLIQVCGKLVSVTVNLMILLIDEAILINKTFILVNETLQGVVLVHLSWPSKKQDSKKTLIK